MNSKTISKTIRYSIVFILLTCGLCLLVAVWVQAQTNHRNVLDYLEDETGIILLEDKTICNNLEDLFSDIAYLAYTFQHYDNTDHYAELAENWSAFLNSKQVYFKLRYLDVNGNEIIKINHINGHVYVSDAGELENKTDRYYFQDAIKLQPGQIYFSRLDLNIEQGVVERPIRPVIRLAMTVYNSDGNPNGLIVLSYEAKNLLNDFESIAVTGAGHVNLINDDGYWLCKGDNTEDEWTFMFKEKGEVSFKNTYPAVWRKMQKNLKGQIITKDGLFVYRRTSLRTVQYIDRENTICSAEGEWFIVSFIPDDAENGRVFNKDIGRIILYTIEKQKLVLAILAILSIVSAGLYAYNQEAKKKMKYYELDPLTKVYTRRAGFERLEKVHKKSARKGNQLCVCFVDINGLKHVNDTLGHEHGDDLLIRVAQTMKTNIGESDFIIRIGGDEFLIVFVSSNINQAEEVWDTICLEFERINATGDIPYAISASHGIEAFTFDVNEFIDKIVNAADEKMYNEKRRWYVREI